ncbi:methyltransferase domain-containing protein [Kitasatospora sp. NPDC004614]|uniref:methyltransferase domain-containing protein n=1 Tax=unclassified Kitasatospora TaxID=2633591 RepID=UPI00367FED78
MDYRRSLERSSLSRKRREGASTFTMQGREWDLLPGVFAPADSPSTATALGLLGLAGPAAAARGSLLEIGCGTGLIAVSGAVAGCERVVASDINPAAVENAQLNAGRHGVAHKVRTVHSDLFDGLDPDERFDTVFWSSNYVMAPESYRYQHMHERAYVDAGYAAHRRFLAEAWRRTTPNGSVLLHFSTRGDLMALMGIAYECGRALRILRTVPVQEGEHLVQHMLLEVVERRRPGGRADAVPAQAGRRG